MRRFIGFRFLGQPCVSIETIGRPGAVPFLPAESQKLYNHSPDGFEWGYGGSGPAQLALAILFEVTKHRELSLQYYQDFKRDTVARFNQPGFIISEGEVKAWLSQYARIPIAEI